MRQRLSLKLGAGRSLFDCVLAVSVFFLHRFHMTFFFKSGWLALAVSTALPAFAQPAHDGHVQKPAQAASSYSTAPQESPPAAMDPAAVFSAYRPYADQEVSSWREANDEVGRIGGWQAYAREAQAPVDSSEPPSTKSGAPAAAPDSEAHKQP